MKRILAVIAIAAFTFALPACKGKVSDADIKKEVEAKLQGTPGVTVDVAEGVVTLSGQVADDAAKAGLEAALKDVKGVKSIANNTTVAPPPAPVVINPDDALTGLVKDALKDNPTVQAAVADGVVTLTGEVKKADLPKLMQKIMALKPKKVDNKLTVK